MKKIKCIIFLLLLCITVQSNLCGQTITHGPIIGAVTDSSAEIVFFSDKHINGNIHLSVTPDFKFELIFPFETDVNNSAKIKLNKLSANTICYFKIFFHNDNEISKYKGNFKTFPSRNDTSHFSFTLGSCTEQHHNDSVFAEMQKHKPAFFLHLGDWLYTNNFNERKFYYTESLEHQKELYQKRYEMPNLKSFLQNTPIDFIFDDEDGVFDDFSEHSYTELQMNGNLTAMKEVPYPDSLRKMAIEGLHTFFPAYNEVKDQAYHSFVYGNAEIFFLDTRSTRSPNSEVFVKTNNGKWKYKVPKGHKILDSAQINWLLTKLQNSKADWKFIISGVSFNQSYRQVMDICMRAQNRILPNGMNGSYVAASLAGMWFAFPETQTQLLNFCHNHKIKNVVVLSGDAHTAAIDDGKNAGFPELMAGGLAQNNSQLASIIKNKLRLNLWNQGGQGIGNANFNDAFGKVEVFGKEMVRLSAVDKFGNSICSYELKEGFIPEKYKLKPRIKIKRLRALKNLLRIAIKN